MTQMSRRNSKGELQASQGLRLAWWSGVLWPSFLAACLLEALTFAVVDPAELSSPLLDGVSGRGVYTLAFFVFWLIAALGCSLTSWLHREID